jgi:hypothetical protein
MQLPEKRLCVARMTDLPANGAPTTGALCARPWSLPRHQVAYEEVNVLCAVHMGCSAWRKMPDPGYCVACV